MFHSRSVPRALVVASLALAVPLTQVVGEHPAAAQSGKPGKPPRPPKGDKKKQAKAYVDQGLAAQEAGDYDAALSFYGKAYELVPHPILLFNMAQANRLAGRAEPARELYKQYLEAEPNGAKAKTARELMTALDAQLAAAQKSGASGTGGDAGKPAGDGATGEGERPAGDGAPADPLKLGSASAAAASRPAEPAPIDDGARARKLRLAGLISGGVGVAGLGVGVVFHLRARSISEELSKPGITFDPDKEASGKSAERLMYVGYIAGGALIAGGAALYFLGRRGASSERVALVPAISQGSVGLVVTGGLP